MNSEAKFSKHSAPGQYLGFALQPVRAFYHLLTSPSGAKVSLEFQDDVAVHYPDGRLLLEQTKSALSQNPISDWAKDLWKAFANWVSMLMSGECQANNTHFRIFVTPAKTGYFVEHLSMATKSEDVNLIITDIRTKLEKSRKLPACADFVKTLLEAPPDIQFGLISNFKLEATSSDPLELIRDILRPTIKEANLEIIARSGIGQAKQAIDRLIQSGEKPIIDADEFRRNFHAFIRLNNLPGFLTSLGDSPSEAVISGVAAARPVFVRQLELIDASEEEQLRAVSDYLRASADKADWADRGEIFSGSLDEWDNDLIKRHRMVVGQVTDLHGDKPAKTQGRLVYRQCAQHQAPLEGRAVPSHFVHGSFNDLADRQRLGWHSEYESLLNGQVE